MELLARDLDLETLDLLTEEIALSQVVERGGALLQGQVRGRVVVDVNR